MIVYGGISPVSLWVIWKCWRVFLNGTVNVLPLYGVQYAISTAAFVEFLCDSASLCPVSVFQFILKLNLLILTERMEWGM